MFDKYDVTPPGRIDDIVEAFDCALEQVKPVCLLKNWGPCEGPLIDGHIVQAAKQRRIAEKNQVRTFDEPSFRTSLEMRKRGKLSLPRLARIGSSTTTGFSCRHHDNTIFAASEDNEIFLNRLDQDITHALNLIAYKSVCGHLAKTRRMAMAWNMLLDIRPNDPMIADLEFYQHHLWIKDYDTHAVMEEVLLGTGTVNMLHEVTETGKKPIIAANGYYPLRNPIIGSSPERLMGVWSPKFVTAYPTRTNQLIITSYVQSPPTTKLPIVKRIGDGHPEDRHFNALVASIALLQECETITISPSAWEDLPEANRRAIVNYYEISVPVVPNEVVEAHRPPPDCLNLFGTSPLRDK